MSANFKKDVEVITHIITNAHILMTKYPKAGLIVGGDKNSLNLSPILQGLPNCRQLVTQNTHNDKCLDILITNLHTLYQPPIIVSPLQPDNPSKAKPSDHLVPILYPITGQSRSVPRHYRTKTTRPLPESGIREFGSWLAGECWEELEQKEGPNE